MVVENLMLKNFITVRPDTPVLTAGAVMLAHHVHQLPVLENSNFVFRKPVFLEKKCIYFLLIYF